MLDTGDARKTFSFKAYARLISNASLNICWRRELNPRPTHVFLPLFNLPFISSLALFLPIIIQYLGWDLKASL